LSIPPEVFEQTLGAFFAPVADFLRDDRVTEILINGANEIYVERKGILAKTDGAFASDSALMSALRNLSQYVGRELSVRIPILEARLPDGSRVEAVIPPASPRGPVVSIRCFRQKRLTLEDLVRSGALRGDVAGLLRGAVRLRKNVLVGGGGGTGKTSLLNVLASLAKPDDRVVVIEDSRELQLNLPHVVSLESQPPDAQGRGGITIRQLLRATLRMRPDRIVIGEIRGGEALDLIQAMTSGHRGCLSTIHGTLPIDALNRLETMALMSDVEVPIQVLRGQIASAIDFVVQLARTDDGVRRVTHVVELAGFHHERGYSMKTLFEARDPP